MQLLRFAHLFIAFALELVLIATFARWGFALGKDTILKYALALGMALLVIVLWGIFAAPRSQHRLPHTPRILFEMALFITASFFLYQLGHTRWAVVFLAVAILSETIAFLSKDPT